MFYGSFGTYNSMVTLILTFDLSSGEIQVKEGQILKRKFFFKNIPILFNFVSGFQKCLFFSSYDNWKFQKTSFKNGIITINRFWAISQPKNKDIGFKFSQVLVAHRPITYIVFWIFIKFCFFAYIFENSKFCFKGFKFQIFKNPRCQFVEHKSNIFYILSLFRAPL